MEYITYNVLKPKNNNTKNYAREVTVEDNPVSVRHSITLHA